MPLSSALFQVLRSAEAMFSALRDGGTVSEVERLQTGSQAATHQLPLFLFLPGRIVHRVGRYDGFEADGHGTGASLVTGVWRVNAI